MQYGAGFAFASAAVARCNSRCMDVRRTSGCDADENRSSGTARETASRQIVDRKNLSFILIFAALFFRVSQSNIVSRYREHPSEARLPAIQQYIANTIRSDIANAALPTACRKHALRPQSWKCRS